jgi:mRNA interferase RelE/StbE
MAWKIEFERSAERELEKLGHEAARRILRFLHDRVARLDDPRAIGEALSGATLRAFWRYRVGDFRIIANIDDKTVRIVVIRVGNGREIYR